MMWDARSVHVNSVLLAIWSDGTLPWNMIFEAVTWHGPTFHVHRMLKRGFQSAGKRRHGGNLPSVAVQPRACGTAAVAGRAADRARATHPGGCGQRAGKQGLLLAYYQLDAMRDSAAETILAVNDGVVVEWRTRCGLTEVCGHDAAALPSPMPF
jgi:hypothetical protein